MAATAADRSPSSGWPRRQRGRIDVRDDGQNARCALGSVHRNVADSPARHGALHQNSVGEARKGHIDRIGGGTHHLETPVDPIQRGADDTNGGCLCSYVRVSRGGKRAHDGALRQFDLEVVVLSRAGSGQRDLGCVAKRVVTRLAACQAPLGLGRAPWPGRDPAQPQPRCSNGVAVEIEDDGR